MKKSFSSFLLFCLVGFMLVSNPVVSTQYEIYTQENLYHASQYLINRYNSTLGLISESEDLGNHWLGYGQYNTTYWLYSDNLFAYKALEDYAPYIANKIKFAYENDYDYPLETLYFGVVFGEDIPNIFHDAINYLLVNDSDKTILYRRHDAETTFDYRFWGDSLCYKALDEYYHGSKYWAKQYFLDAYNMFDGYGIYDYTTQTDSFYSNYKLGLLLYTGRLLGVYMESEEAIEQQLWRAQDETNYGIISLTDLNGEPSGSANVETTALALLAYSELITTQELRNNIMNVFESYGLPLVIFCLILSYVFRGTFRKWTR